MFYFGLIVIGVAGMLFQPAFAQTKPASTAVTFDSVLQAGYEIKAVNFIPVAQANEISGANAPKSASQTMVTPQKGTSIAVRTLDSGTWSVLTDDIVTNPIVCEKR
jgi:hypothetical protein